MVNGIYVNSFCTVVNSKRRDFVEDVEPHYIDLSHTRVSVAVYKV